MQSGINKRITATKVKKAQKNLCADEILTQASVSKLLAAMIVIVSSSLSQMARKILSSK